MTRNDKVFQPFSRSFASVLCECLPCCKHEKHKEDTSKPAQYYGMHGMARQAKLEPRHAAAKS